MIHLFNFYVKLAVRILLTVYTIMIRRSRLYVRMNQPTIAARLNLRRPSASCTLRWLPPSRRTRSLLPPIALVAYPA
jgi:hypothetical protein